MFQNRVAVVVNSAFFERDLRKHTNRRCNYRKLLSFFTADETDAKAEGLSYGNYFNNDDRVTDIVRALYVTSQTVYRGNGLENRNNDAHERFLSALRSMNYEVVNAYNSIDAHFVLEAMQIAQSGTVDTVVLCGLTVDHVPMIWALRSAGVRVMAMFADTYHVSERLKDAVNWYYQIKVEDGFLTEELKERHHHDEESDDDELEEDEGVDL